VNFYKIFCLGIFREALIEVIQDIETLNDNFEDLPLILKLAAYRRNLLLASISRNDNALKERGRGILECIKLYKDSMDPEAVKKLDFDDFVNDPLGQNSGLTDDQK
jgi:hypothetical protein